MAVSNMLSLSLSTVCWKPLYPVRVRPCRRSVEKGVSAIIRPSEPQSQQPQLYQPFRPPPSPLPSKFGSLDTAGRIEILANRLGVWHEYAPLIPCLIREGFTPPSIEEATGISGVEQNRLVVAAQVRDSLLQSNADPDTLAAFDTGGSELLYEIRLLSASQRVAAASYIVVNNLDGLGARDLARAMKDFPRRRGDRGWESFDYNLPGDCLSFMYYRQSREHRNPSEQRTAALEQALGVAQTEKARSQIMEELRGKEEEEEEAEEKEKEKGTIQEDEGVRVPVVRLKMGEVAEASSVAILPVCRAGDEEEMMEAPMERVSEGEFGVVAAEKGWNRWVVLPGWEPVMSLGKGGVVLSFRDARVLPWKVNRWYKEEPILVVLDRTRNHVSTDSGFYLVSLADGFKVERGSSLKASGVHVALATVVLVVRPPREDTDDQLADEDWD